MAYFDRYNNFRVNAEMKPIPGLQIPVSDSDKYVLYKLGETRLDKMSNLYYNSPYYNWLILLANPEFGGLEFLIPDRTIIRVPFSFESAINRYLASVYTYKSYYGDK